MGNEKRQNQRVPVALRIKLRYRKVDTFVSKFATNISEGGMFISSRTPKEPGTELRFELRLADDSRLIAGRGLVKWVRKPDPDRPKAPRGMGIEFLSLSQESKKLVERIVEQRRKQGLGMSPEIPYHSATQAADSSVEEVPGARAGSPPALSRKLAAPGLSAEVNMDVEVDMASALGRARKMLSPGDRDDELSRLSRVSASPVAVTVEDASAELAAMLGGDPVRNRRVSAQPDETRDEGAAELSEQSGHPLELHPDSSSAESPPASIEDAPGRDPTCRGASDSSSEDATRIPAALAEAQVPVRLEAGESAEEGPFPRGLEGDEEEDDFELVESDAALPYLEPEEESGPPPQPALDARDKTLPSTGDFDSALDSALSTLDELLDGDFEDSPLSDDEAFAASPAEEAGAADAQQAPPRQPAESDIHLEELEEIDVADSVPAGLSVDALAPDEMEGMSELSRPGALPDLASFAELPETYVGPDGSPSPVESGSTGLAAESGDAEDHDPTVLVESEADAEESASEETGERKGLLRRFFRKG